jgi:L-lactate dehydrogenase complex protein LldG
VVMLENISELDEEIAAEKSAGNFIINLLDKNAGEQVIPTTPAELARLSKLYLNGGVAVAENGSIWVDDQLMKVRLLPFICEQLVIVIRKENIVATMHHAYARLGKIDTGFGVFIAGPSKTADIEQSLVIGAHGAKGLCVYIV